MPDYITAGIGTRNGGLIPLRFQYPVTERTVNKPDDDASVSCLFGGKGDIIANMWIIK